MTLKQLEIFAEVCRTSSMSIAAGNLFISQSAVSQCIKELENGYRVKLFDRISHKLYLTQDGRKLLDYAHNILSYSNFIEESMTRRNQKARLRIGTLIPDIVINITHFFQKDYPDIDVNILQDFYPNLEIMLKNTSLDMIITDKECNPLEFNSSIITSNDVKFICRKDTSFPQLQGEHPQLTINQLSEIPLYIWYTDSMARYHIENKFRSRGIPFSFAGIFMHESVLKAIFNDMGVGIVSSAVLDTNSSFKIIDVPEMQLKRYIYAVTNANSEIKPQTRNFIDFAAEKIHEVRKYNVFQEETLRKL